MSQKLPLMLLPGLLCDAALWQHQVNSLITMADCQVADLTQHETMTSLARAVLSAAPPQFALAALSMGGYVALEIMRQAPERVIKLCMLDTSARADTPEQKERRRLLLVMSQSGKFKGVTPRLLPLLIHPARMDDKELTATIFAMAERVGREAFHRQQTAILNRIDSHASLKQIKCPVSVICGRQDVLTPPEITREIADGISGAEFTIIEDSGHLTALERPERVNQIMKKWLAG